MSKRNVMIQLFNRAAGAEANPMNIPACIVCSRTPAELTLFGKPYCEECAHNLITDAATENRRLISFERDRQTPLALTVRDGVEGFEIGDMFVPAITETLASAR